MLQISYPKVHFLPTYQEPVSPMIYLTQFWFDPAQDDYKVPVLNRISRFFGQPLWDANLSQFPNLCPGLVIRSFRSAFCQLYISLLMWNYVSLEPITVQQLRLCTLKPIAARNKLQINYEPIATQHFEQPAAVWYVWYVYIWYV